MKNIKLIQACFFMMLLIFTSKISAVEIEAPTMEKPTVIEINSSIKEEATAPAVEVKTPLIKEETKPLIKEETLPASEVGPSLPVNDEVSNKATLKGAEVEYCLKYDPNKWETMENKVNPNAEFLLKAKNREAYALIIPENTPVLLEHMPEVIKFNAEKAGMKDATIVKQEMKKVNGQDALFVEWEGTFDTVNAKIVYIGLIYSGEKGTVQVYTYTTKNHLDEYRQDMLDFINGFCILNEQAVKTAA